MPALSNLDRSEGKSVSNLIDIRDLDEPQQPHNLTSQLTRPEVSAFADSLVKLYASKKKNEKSTKPTGTPKPSPQPSPALAGIAVQGGSPAGPVSKPKKGKGFAA